MVHATGQSAPSDPLGAFCVGGGGLQSRAGGEGEGEGEGMHREVIFSADSYLHEF